MKDEVLTSSIERIAELDLVVIKDPTNVWLLDESVAIDELRIYEQWEKGRLFKAKAVYYHSSGAEFYLKNEDDKFGVRDIDTSEPDIDELHLAPERPGKRHKVLPGEDIYSIGLHYKTPWQKILEHNELAAPGDVKEGQWLYIPTHHEAKDRKHIEYRLLDTPRPMHVTREGGVTKYSFGGVKKWADIKEELKHYAQGYNVDICAIAKVPVEDTIAAYYMDRHDLGKYRETGRVAYTRGYNWQHLAEGHTTVKKPVSKIEKIVADAMAEDDRPQIVAPVEVPAPVVVEEPEEAPISPLEVELDDYKTSFKYLNFEESPEQFKLLETMDIRELDGMKPPIHRKADSSVMVSGWFMYNGTPYYRVATRWWYAIPTQSAYSVEDEAFNGLNVDLPTRIAMGGTLTREERQVALLAKAAAKYNRLKSFSGLLRRK